VLAVQIVNCLTSRLCYFTGCVPDRPSYLITNAFACQLIVPGCSADALFEPAGETSASSGKPLFRSPQSGPPRGILYIIVSGRVLRTRLVEHNVRHESDSYTRDTPRKSFHLTNLLVVGCTYRKGRVAQDQPRTRKPGTGEGFHTYGAGMDSLKDALDLSSVSRATSNFNNSAAVMARSPKRIKGSSTNKAAARPPTRPDRASAPTCSA
jgi:hypothetical protein